MRRLLPVMAALAAAALSAAGAGSSAGQSRWVLTDLGTLGGKTSNAVAINERGQIVGWSETRTGKTHPFVWRSGKMTDLGTLAGRAGWGSAAAINERGQIVGDSETATGSVHPFLWQSGKMTDLGTLGGLRDSSRIYSALGINERGQIVGMSRSSYSYGTNRGFVWSDGRMVGIGQESVIGSPDGPRPFALNARGQVVGSCCSKSAMHAFVWQSGRLTDLGTLPHGGFSYATAVNDRGQIIGWGGFGSRYGGSRALTWHDGRPRELGNPSRADWSKAEAINDSGAIVGEERKGTKPVHAVLWQRDGTMKRVGPRGRDSYASAITNKGQVVIGTVGPDLIGLERERAFVWEHGRLTDLGTLGGKTSHASTINEHNQIVGWSTAANGRTHAVLWTLRPGG